MCKKLFCSILLVSIISACAGAIEAPMVGLWKFDEGGGSVALDKSGNGHNGTIISAQHEAGGFDGSGFAMRFSGQAATRVTVGTFDVEGPGITLACWLNASNLDTPGQDPRMISKATGGAADAHIFLLSSGRVGGTKVIRFRLRTDNGLATTTLMGSTADATLVVDEWIHAAATWDGETMRIYKNGLEAGTAARGGNAVYADSTVGVCLGNQPVGAEDRPFEGLIDEAVIFADALSPEEILEIMEGIDVTPELASEPVPAADESDVLRDAVLSWTPGIYAQTHNIYLGTSFEDVNNADVSTPRGVLASEGQTGTSFTTDRLDFGTRYYWRVDEVNAPARPATFKGPIWSFTVESLAYPVTPTQATASSSFMPTMGPEKTIDGSGLDEMDQHGSSGSDMWLTAPTDTERWIQYGFDKPQKLYEMLIWNSNQAIESFVGFGSKSVTIETSLDGSTWTPLADVPEFAQATGLPSYIHNTVVDFAGVTAQYVKLTVNAGWGTLTTQSGLSEVRFLAIPVYASQPDPENGSTVESIDVTLSWRPGRQADTHEVVLSSDRAAVEAGTGVVGNPTASSITQSALIYGTEYFWRINEVNGVAETPRYEGDIWSFTAPSYLVIDDFELYDDQEFLEIWAFWADGYQDDNNGAIVGNGNIGERAVVYQGGQSMPIHFDNSGAAISEVTREFDTPLDWLTGHPDILSLQVRGDAPGFIDGGDTLTIGGSGADIWNVADEFRFVYKTLNGNGSITAKVESLTHVHDWAKAGVMIRESLTPESACAYTCATGASGVTFQYRTATFTSAASDSSTRDASWADQEEPVWVRVERVDDEFNGYISLDGVNWTGSVSNPQTITMLPEVKIGFCVTSHDNNQSSTAVFSNVSTTGSVSGNWSAETFGEGHPDNDAAPMYLVVRDSTGGEKTVTHPNPDATVITNWEAWQIPLNDLGSVNLGSIKSITIGVGTPGGSATGDQGTVFIDLLQVGTP